MRHAFVVLALEHPIVTHWHYVVSLVIRFCGSGLCTIFFVFSIQTIRVAVLSTPINYVEEK